MRRNPYPYVILLAALAVRLAFLPVGLKQAESRGANYFDEYGGIARNIVEGNGFSYRWFGELHRTSIHPPVYPYIIAGIFRVFGEGPKAAAAAIMLSMILSLLLIMLVYRSVSALFGRLAGSIAMTIAAFYPSQIYYSVSGLPTVFYALMLFLVIAGAWLLKEKPSAAGGAAWGIVIGVCVLSYSFVLILAPVAALWVIASAGRPKLEASFLAVIAAALVAVAICVPWTVRNYRIHQRWIPIRDQSGTNLWWGNGPYATGGPVDVEGNEIPNFPAEVADVLRSIPNEVDGDRYLRDEAVRYMKENPGRTARLWLRKLGHFWWFGDEPVAAGSGIGHMLPVLKILKALLLAASAAGFIILIIKKPSAGGLGLLVCAAMSAIFMVYHSGRQRYFVPLEPVLIAVSAYAIASLAGPFIERLAACRSRQGRIPG